MINPTKIIIILIPTAIVPLIVYLMILWKNRPSRFTSWLIFVAFCIIAVTFSVKELASDLLLIWIAWMAYILLTAAMSLYATVDQFRCKNMPIVVADNEKKLLSKFVIGLIVLGVLGLLWNNGALVIFGWGGALGIGTAKLWLRKHSKLESDTISAEKNSDD